LKRGACHLWHWRPDFSPERGIRFLSPDELERFHRFLVPAPARTFLAARVGLRSLLSAYSDLKPEAWRFDLNPWGRPHIANPDAPAALRFNLSHKPGRITCLIACDREVGVDVEDLFASRKHLLNIADRFFSPSEVIDLKTLPVDRQLDRFFELWTLKESYIKARGRGLSLGLSKFSFSPKGDTATVRFDPDFDDDPEAWEFRLFRPDPQFLIATTIERVAGLPSGIRIEDAAKIVQQAL
jgi:4'-phosphopantetheinyl transferase